MAADRQSFHDWAPPNDWTALQRQYEAVMCATVRRVMKSSSYGEDSILGESAEDIVSDVFVALRESGKNPADLDKPKSYLCTTAANATVSLLRRAGYDRPLTHESHLEASPTDATILLTKKLPTQRRTNERGRDGGAQ
jgi:DNA-directed RNA polymerase specialized sigma24 family protein